MQALILAGGRSRRLRPLTDFRPSALLYLPGGTLIDYLIAQLRLLPISRIGVVLQYEGEQVARHLSTQPDIDLIPQYLPLTMMSALSSAQEWVHEPTLVLHVTNYFGASLRSTVGPTLARGGNPEAATFFVPSSEEGLAPPTEAAAYLLPPKAFALAHRVADQDSLGALTDILPSREVEVRTAPLRGWHRTISTPDDLLAANHYLLSTWHDNAHPAAANIGYNPMELNWIAPTAEAEMTGVGLYVTVGEEAEVRRSRLHNCLVFPGVHLGRAEVDHAILAPTRNGLLRVYATSALQQR